MLKSLLNLEEARLYGKILSPDDVEDFMAQNGISYDELIEMLYQELGSDYVEPTEYSTTFIYPQTEIIRLTYTQPEENKEYILSTISRMLKNYFNAEPEPYITQLSNFSLGEYSSGDKSIKSIFKEFRNNENFPVFIERVKTYWSKNFDVMYATMSHKDIWDYSYVDKKSCLRNDRYSERWYGAKNGYQYMVINSGDRQERLLFRIEDDGVAYGNKYGVLFHRSALKGIFETISGIRLNYKVVKYEEETPFYNNGDWKKFLKEVE